MPTDPQTSEPRKRLYFDEDFGFRSMLEENFAAIRDEWLALPPDAPHPWPHRDGYSGRWDVFALYSAGLWFNGNCRRVPRTTELLTRVPKLRQAGFSILGPGTRLARHTGVDTEQLRCHLGVVVTDDAALWVDGEVREWEEGKTIVFDDLYEHEAWNGGTEDRVLLMVDFVRDPALMAGRAPQPQVEGETRALFQEAFPDWMAEASETLDLEG